MLPSQLKADLFRHYPPEAARLAADYLGLLQRLPLAFVPLLLQQTQEYDWKFPAERKEIKSQLSYLGSLSQDQLNELLAGFAQLQLPGHLEKLDWVDSPVRFSEELSASLWTTHQIGAFTRAATGYMEKFHAAVPPETLPAPRLGIAVIGKDVERSSYPLFRKLRPQGVYFTSVNPADGLRVLIEAAAARAAAYPVPFAHWYVDGGQAAPVPDSPLLGISYADLGPVRKALLEKIHGAISGGIEGPEALTSMLHKMRPEEIGLSGKPQDEVVSHFVASVLTFGSGTQIFSTTFVQWTARELWRRAQPLTLFARFAPRQRQRPMNELLSGKEPHPEPDLMGSLIDADMGAFYMWIDQQRLEGAKEASFLVWFENHGDALVVSPSLPRNTVSNNPVTMRWLLAQVA